MTVARSPAPPGIGRDALLASLPAMVVVGGLLDATAIANTSGFGVGLFIGTSGLAGLTAIAAMATSRSASLSIGRLPLRLALVAMAAVWLVGLAQVASGIADPTTMFTQSTFRILLLGHFLVAMAVFSTATVDEVERPLRIFLGIFLAYGLYDLLAQILSLPRFLDFLRNNTSFHVSESVGAQGWIRLPRLSSLAAEPSLTTSHVALSLFVAMRLQGWRRRLFLALTLIFLVGTFARSLWIVIGAATLIAGGFALLQRLRFDRTMLIGACAVMALVLPLLATVIPAITSTPVGADISTIKRFDTSRIALQLFLDHPLLGVGFQGWGGYFNSYSDMIIGSPLGVVSIHNGIAVYLAALGVAGLLVIYLPMLAILNVRDISPVAAAWWIAIFGLIGVGGDFLTIASTWTALALAVALSRRRDTPC